MLSSDERSFALSVTESTATYAFLKAHEGVLSPVARSVLGKLEKFLYDSLSIEEMELIVREISQ